MSNVSWTETPKTHQYYTEFIVRTWVGSKYQLKYEDQKIGLPVRSGVLELYTPYQP